MGIRLRASVWNGASVGVGALALGMNSRIRAPGSMDGHMSAAKLTKRMLQGILDRPPARLALPSEKPAAIIGDREPQPHACESSQLWRRICAAT